MKVQGFWVKIKHHLRVKRHIKKILINQDIKIKIYINIYIHVFICRGMQWYQGVVYLLRLLSGPLAETISFSSNIFGKSWKYKTTWHHLKAALYVQNVTAILKFFIFYRKQSRGKGNLQISHHALNTTPNLYVRHRSPHSHAAHLRRQGDSAEGFGRLINSRLNEGIRGRDISYISTYWS